MFVEYMETPVGILKIIANNDCLTSVLLAKNIEDDVSPNVITKETILQLGEYFLGTRQTFSIPLDIVGTDFQKQVYNGLLDIPFGETISYKQLAINIGNNKACRAVGNANNKNKIYIIVPCHRVIGNDGSLVGYGGGLEMKKWLIDHERHYML